MTVEKDSEEQEAMQISFQKQRKSTVPMSSSPIYFTIRFTKWCVIMATLFAATSMIMLAQHTFANRIEIEKAAAIEQASSERVSWQGDMITKPHEVQMTVGANEKPISYYHCGDSGASRGQNPIKMTLK